MKRKFENIAIVLFLAVLVSSIIGIIFIQQVMSSVVRSSDLNQASLHVTRFGNNLLYIIAVLIFFSLMFLILVFQTAKKVKNEKLTSFTKDLDKEVEERSNPEEKVIIGSVKKLEQQKFENLQQSIEILNSLEITSLNNYCDKILSAIAVEYQVFQGLFYTIDKNIEQNDILKVSGSYAFNKNTDHTLKLGEGLAGQVAKAKRTVNIKQIPSGYIKAISGLGESTPSNLLICPIVDEEKTLAVIELATFKEFSKEEENYFASISSIIKDKLLALR